MSTDIVHGLGCPRCGGIVPVPEGQVLVICPYCDLRSVVSAAPARQGERGVRRYQVPLRVEREQVEAAFRRFVSGKVQVARDCSARAQVSELFLVHLPFWVVWGRGVGWAFGQEQVGSGDNKRFEPREKREISELTWNSPACEVGEFGVRRVSLDGRPLESFDAAALHRSGMVFEPVGSTSAAIESAQSQFSQEIKNDIHLDRTEQQFVRLTNIRLGLVYYPVWVLRYHYRGRSFQVVVDGFDGEILYGKAPGSVGYRAGVLVGGMAAGAVLTVDVPVLILSSRVDDDGIFVILIGSFVAGIGLMIAAYRTFRHSEHYEFHRYKALSLKLAGEGMTLGSLNLSMKNVEDVVRNLEKLQ